MATLKTQYKNYLKENPDSNISYEEWEKNIFSEKLKFGLELGDDFSDWDVTLMDGLEENENNE